MSQKKRIIDFNNLRKSTLRYKTIIIKEITPKNEEVGDNDFIVVEYKGQKLWVLFKCPCGCNYVISLTLQIIHFPRWSFYKSKNNRPTLYPSVWQTKGCFSHFWISDGFVFWTSNTGRDPNLFKDKN